MVSAKPPTARSQPLSAGHFRRIAERGFGGGRNGYAYSYAWFNDHLYIGTNREALQVIFSRWPFEMPFEMFPVPVPDGYEKLDLRGQIWRFNPRTEVWQRVFRAPMVHGFGDRLVPVAVGFRCMTVFQGKSDPSPALYTLPVVGRNSPGSSTLRSLDGVNFEALAPPQVEGEQETFGSFRAVQPFKGRLFVAPSHTKGDPRNLRTDANVVQDVDVRCTDDPVSGKWQISCPTAFGDPTNVGIIEMQVAGNYLYVSTINVRHGFQLWRTDGEGPAPHRWEMVFDRGADRGPTNQAALSMAEFQGDLYLGTAIQNGGHDRVNNVGPAAGEVIRVRADRSWDLIMGQPRQTRHGLKVPTSGLGPGFENPLAGYIWRMCAHDGALYVGTYDLSSMLPYVDRAKWHEHVRRIFDPATAERFLKLRGGAELWRTTDGDNWMPVTRNGFGNRYNFGIRALISTPRGLFVGTANPFGPVVAVKGPGGWRYEDNPRGGLEIWHGSLENAGGRQRAPEPSEAGPAEVAEMPPASQVENISEVVYAADSPESRAAMFLADEPSTHSIARAEAAVWDTCKYGPVMGLAVADKDLWGLNETVADEVARYFDQLEPRNAGYWREETVPPHAAAQALVDELLKLLPETETPPRTVLVIDRCADALAIELAHRVGDGTATMIPIGGAADRSPTKRGFWRRGPKHPRDIQEVPPSGCDVVVWIEGPSAQSRSHALAQVARVLRPGGTLLAAELLGHRITGSAERSADDSGEPGAGVASYERDLAAAGLVDSRIIDITRLGWQRFYRASRKYFLTRLLFHQIDSARHGEILRALPGGDLAVEAHLLISARKVTHEVPRA